MKAKKLILDDKAVYLRLSAAKLADYANSIGSGGNTLFSVMDALDDLQKQAALFGAALTYKTLSADIPGLILPPEHRMHQRAVGVGLLALQKQAAGESGDGQTLTPNYLRLSQAERERMERENR